MVPYRLYTLSSKPEPTSLSKLVYLLQVTKPNPTIFDMSQSAASGSSQGANSPEADAGSSLQGTVLATNTPATSPPQIPQTGQRQTGTIYTGPEVRIPRTQPVSTVPRIELKDLTLQGTRSALEGLVEPQDGYYELQDLIFGSLDDDSYDALRRLNSQFNMNLTENSPNQPHDLGPNEKPLQRLGRLLPFRCDEFCMSRYLAQNGNAAQYAAYNGRCPNQKDMRPRPVLRNCQGMLEQKLGHPVLVPQGAVPGARHQREHLVCDRCRSLFWNTTYVEPLWGVSSNNLRLTRILSLDQERSVCMKCDLLARSLHPQPINLCTCYRDLYESTWRCMGCTRGTLNVVREEARWKMGMMGYLKRDGNGQLNFDRRTRHRRPRCMCDRGTLQPLRDGTQTLQCIRCEQFHVRMVSHNLPRIKRSQRIKNRKLREWDQPALEMLVTTRGRPRTARINRHGFES